MHTVKASFRKRIMVTGLLLSFVIVGFLFYVYRLVSQTSHNNIASIKSSQQIGQILNDLNDQLHRTERDIYELAILPDDIYKKSLMSNFSELQTLANRLAAIPYRKSETEARLDFLYRAHYNKFRLLSSELKKDISQLDEPIRIFTDIAFDVEKRFPGMPLLLKELLPRNNQFLEAVDLAIFETKQSANNGKLKEQTLALFNDARYLWTQQANWVRLFVSNRYGVFGESQKSMQHSLQNRTLYMTEVVKVVDKIKRLETKGKLDLQQSLSLDEMVDVISEYEGYFVKTRDIYLSKEWRNDLSLLRDNIRPRFLQVWNTIDAFYDVLNIHDRHSINQSQSAMNTVSLFVLLSGVAIFFTFGVGYFLFEKTIRKPLISVAEALDAEAKGHALDKPILNYVYETDVLIQAFNNMKEQVNFRQLRLESILDNAAEGIVTIDDKGTIETFNVAAQFLFGYDLNEVIGKNISMLIPHAIRAEHNTLLKNLKNGRGLNVLGSVREVEAQKKDGVIFPMSLKISEMNLGGEVYYTAVVEDISQRKEMIGNLQYLAEHDSLTGLYNRHYFSEELDKFVIRKNRGDSNYAALLYVDLDNLKYVNDTMGHLAGDELIIEASVLLKARTRDSDIIARLGGDEFAIFLYRADLVLIEDVANSFRSLLEDYTFKYDGKIAATGCSIGVAVLDDTIATKEDLLAKADFACHEAKRRGRNQVHVYMPDDDVRISNMSNEIGWVQRIKNALDNDGFVLAYQPIHNLSTKNNDYFEVLIRMRDIDNGLIMPSGFLSSAERFNLMVQIDTWVISHSIKYMSMRVKADKYFKLSINLSASSVEDKNIIQLIKDKIEEHNIRPENLIFEVTETIAMNNIQNACNMLKELQEMGCKTALDDFGIGYSSFAYLKDLPIDIVKIDGSFVKNIATDSLHLAMVRSINDIAHEMGKKTVAEFVEDEGCIKILTELNVDYGQGYHIGKPVLEDDLFS